MRLIPCRKIREGMELARDVVTGPPGTAPLLRTGVLLSERYARALPQAKQYRAPTGCPSAAQLGHA